MKTTLARTVALLRKSYAEQLTAEEQAEVNQLLADKRIQKLYAEIENDEYLIREFQRYISYQPSRGYQGFQVKKRKMRIRKITLRLSIAASLVIALGSVWWLKYHEGYDQSLLMTEIVVAPGSSHAFLQLSSGKQIALDSDNQLDIHDIDGAIRVDSGKVVYPTSQTTANPVKDVYNVLSVPRGGEYHLKLNDGTIIHLNADSELKYPVVFTGNERRVFLKGEAWFEVAKEATRPFYVETNELKIRVYGTKFNINTHGLHTMETVLVDGEIGISKKESPHEWRMHPGQLANYDRHSGKITLQEVDVREYIAWKEGEFCFNADALEEILEELGRWYNMDISFRSPEKKEIQFSGHLKRYENIHKILNTITESTGIAFEINGRTVIVK